jgi:hypothetical protein
MLFFMCPSVAETPDLFLQASFAWAEFMSEAYPAYLHHRAREACLSWIDFAAIMMVYMLLRSYEGEP